MSDFDSIVQEIVDTNDLFENDDLVLMETVVRNKLTDAVVKNIEIGFKDADGDIMEITVVKSQYIKLPDFIDGEITFDM